MKRALMLFTAVAVFAAPAMTPLSAMAQDSLTAEERQQMRAARRAEASGGEAPAISPQQRQERQQEPERPREPEADRPDRPNRPDRPDQPQRPERPDQPDRPDRPNRPDGERPDRPDRPDRPNRPDQPDSRWERREDRRDDRLDRRHDRREDRWERREDRRDYREFRNRFNQDQWRRSWERDRRSNWWRSDRRFNGWSGVRLGFYFAPGYGYYNVPRRYYGQAFHVGQYLPSTFWRYRLDDHRTFGLGYPPAGTRWVYVDNAIYLIDDYDGYIIEVIRNAWRW